MGIDALLYAGCMATAQQVFDTMVRQLKTDTDNDDVHNDDDNEVGDRDP